MKRTFVIALAVTLGLFVAGTAIAARNSSGTYSLPNSPVAAGQTITSTWANSTLSDIKTELTDSLSRSGKGGMTAPLRTADGSSSFPAWSFTNETGTGIYRNGTNDVRLVMGSTAVQTWAASSVQLTGGSSTFLVSTGAGATVNAATGTGFLAQVNGSNHFYVTSTAINAYSKPIQNVTDPTSAQDAATKNYVDTAPGGANSVVASPTWNTLTVGGAGCSAGTVAPAYTKIKGIVYIRGGLSVVGATTCTLSALPQYYRPGANIAALPVTSSANLTTSSYTITATTGAFSGFTTSGNVTFSLVATSFPAEQ